MHSFALAAPLLIASALAQSPTTTTSVPYSNPFTSLTTQTDSRGVVTGMPTIVTSQPPPASIPAGLTSGVYTLPYGNTTSFVVSVGGGSTVVVSNSPTPTNGAGATTGTGGALTTSTSAPANVVGVAGGPFAAAVAALVAALL